MPAHTCEGPFLINAPSQGSGKVAEDDTLDLDEDDVQQVCARSRVCVCGGLGLEILFAHKAEHLFSNYQQ
jgi:hypothetical protein